jgi:hypothetical protein
MRETLRYPPPLNHRHHPHPFPPPGPPVVRAHEELHQQRLAGPDAQLGQAPHRGADLLRLEAGGLRQQRGGTWAAAGQARRAGVDGGREPGAALGSAAAQAALRRLAAASSAHCRHRAVLPPAPTCHCSRSCTAACQGSGGETRSVASAHTMLHMSAGLQLSMERSDERRKLASQKDLGRTCRGGGGAAGGRSAAGGAGAAGGPRVPEGGWGGVEQGRRPAKLREARAAGRAALWLRGPALPRCQGEPRRGASPFAPHFPRPSHLLLAAAAGWRVQRLAARSAAAARQRPPHHAPHATHPNPNPQPPHPLTHTCSFASAHSMVASWRVSNSRVRS